MPPDPLLEDDEQYASSEDSDFAPEDAAVHESEASDVEDDVEKTATAKRKRAADDHEAEDAGFENSGDEAVITKAKKRRKKTKNQDAAPADEDEGGEGGLVKTRSMRAAEKAERKVTASSGPVTVDVDALWAQMLAGPSAPPTQNGAETGVASLEKDTDAPEESVQEIQPSPKKPQEDPSEMVRIKRTYNFAGKVHTEEKLVARDSAEAKLYFASQGADADRNEEETSPQPKRVLKKAFRSAFEPLIEITPQRNDLNLGMTVRIKAREEMKDATAKKLNTVEKSKMDWAGFVDKEGLKDELELAGKSKDSFAERQQFLARSEARREDDARKVRIAGRV